MGIIDNFKNIAELTAKFIRYVASYEYLRNKLFFI